MTPAEWLQHGSEAVVVLGATVAVLRKTAGQIARFENAIEASIGNMKRIDEVSLKLEAHIAAPPEQAHVSPAPNGRGPLPSSPGTA